MRNFVCVFQLNSLNLLFPYDKVVSAFVKRCFLFLPSICLNKHIEHRYKEDARLPEQVDIIKIVLSMAEVSGGRKSLSCSKALTIAKKLGVTPREVGRVCNDNNIKICKCRIGCFK